MGLDLQVGLDTVLGNVALAVLMSEALEPPRLPLVVATLPACCRKTDRHGQFGRESTLSLLGGCRLSARLK